MFQLFRSRKRAFRIMIGVIVAPVVITMVVTLIPGIGATGSSSDDTVLAEVGGDAVTLRETQYEFRDYVQQQRVPAGAHAFVAPKIVNDLIIDKAMLQEAERLGLGVTEAELADLLRTSLPFLFQGGSFLGKDQYAAFVQERFQKSIPEFEAAIRKDLALTKLRRLVTDGVTVSDQDVEKEWRRRNEKARIEYVTVSAAAFQSQVSVTEAEIQDHFQKNKSTYVLPERRSLKYMVIDDAKVAAKIQLTPADLERHYRENLDRFRVQDRARVTHILLKTTDRKDDEIRQIEARAQDLLKQARAGKDFAELAKAHSEDSVSAQKGGEVGWITRGQTVPEFEQKAFSMKPGEISELVKTQYGFHIIKLLEREQARAKPFAEVADTIRQELMRDRSEQERARWADRARAAANKHGQNLEKAGEEVGLAVLNVNLVERGAPLPEAGAEAGLMDALFSASKGVVIGPIFSPARAVIAVVTDIAASRQAELPDVYDRVKADATQAKARQMAEARAREIVARAQAAGSDLRKAAKEFRLDVQTSEPFTRDGAVPGVGAGVTLAEAFTAPIHGVVGPIHQGNDQIVYRLLERVVPDAGPSADEKRALREGILGTRQNEAYEVFKDELRERLKRQGKIKTYQERIDRWVKTSS
jgi:peptidyl-prolyl cis-trans isomerase D